MAVIVPGRLDFEDRSFGKTTLKKFPPYVYSKLGGMLLHRIVEIEAWWYTPTGQYSMRRLDHPKLVIRVACGQWFLGGKDHAGRPLGRAQACRIPRPDTVHCGRCNGGPATLQKSGDRAFRADCKRRLGCVVEVP